MDILDPEAPTIDDRPRWEPVYMGEGHAERCGNCWAVRVNHQATDDELICWEPLLRARHGDR